MSLASVKKEGFSRAARSRARRLAAQALYQWQLTGQDSQEIDAEFHQERDLKGADVDYFRELVKQIPARANELDQLLLPALDRSVEELDPVERAILRMAVYELAHHEDVPYRVVINEAVILTKKFGAVQAHTYVNGVLDRIAHDIRSEEISNASGD